MRNDRRATIVFLLAPLLWGASMRMAQAAEQKIRRIIEDTVGLIEIVTVLVFTLAVLVFGWGFVKLFAAAGSPEKIKQAKGIIWWGVIGMFVLASIAGIISLLQKEVGIEAIKTIPAPQFTPQ